MLLCVVCHDQNNVGLVCKCGNCKGTKQQGKCYQCAFHHGSIVRHVINVVKFSATNNKKAPASGFARAVREFSTLL